MPAIKDANSSLFACESELRRSAAGALNDGEYTTARTVLSLAEAVAELRKRPEMDIDASSDAKSSESKVGASSKLKGAKPQGSPKPTRRTKPSDYPRFVRRSDKLIKIGWSKRNRQEYEHKAPKSAAFAFAAHLRSQTRDGKIFTIDALVPVPDPLNDGELPAYQVYLALAWFRVAGIVIKHGRDGYSVKHADLSEKSMAQHWNVLSSEDI